MMYMINMKNTTDENAIDTIHAYLLDNPDLWEDGVYCHARRSVDDDDVIELIPSYRGADYTYSAGDSDIIEMIEQYEQETGKDATDWMNGFGGDYWSESSKWLHDKAAYFWDQIKKEA